MSETNRRDFLKSTAAVLAAPAIAADLTAGVEQLHLSASLAHFANIAYKTGRLLHFDTRKENFTGDEEATQLLARQYRAPYVIM